MMNELSRWLRGGEPTGSPVVSERYYLDSAPPICFIVDEEEKHRHFMSLVLQGHGIETGLFTSASALREGLARRKPDLVFLDVPTMPTNAMESVRALVSRDYHGPLQLMSGNGDVGLEAIKHLSTRNDLKVLPVVK